MNFYDENGNEISFEIVHTFSIDDQDYAAISFIENVVDEQDGVYLCRVLKEGDDEIAFEIISDDEELTEVIQYYEELQNEQQ